MIVTIRLLTLVIDPDNEFCIILTSTNEDSFNQKKPFYLFVSQQES